MNKPTNITTLQALLEQQLLTVPWVGTKRDKTYLRIEGGNDSTIAEGLERGNLVVEAVGQRQVGATGKKTKKVVEYVLYDTVSKGSVKGRIELDTKAQTVLAPTTGFNATFTYPPTSPFVNYEK